MNAPAVNLHERVLVLLPSTRDAERTATLLRAESVPSFVCSDVGTLCREVRLGVGAILLTDDFVLGDGASQLADTLRAQPSWSAVPIVIIAREAATQRVQKEASPALDGVIVVERPVRVHSLFSVLHSALRNRRHQYQIRDDIDERKKMHDALASQAEQLRDADRKKDHFLATLAHELRNPLAPIRTGIDVLRARAAEGTPADRTLGVMDRQITHMVRLIDDLLDVSRITRGILELRKEPASLGSVVEAAVEASRAYVLRGGHELRVAVSEPELELAIDGTRIAQAVSNLLINASKYTSDGGHLEVTATRRAGMAVLQVRDDGIGIPAERLRDVFEMFSQVDPKRDSAQGGLGIGLALVRTVVEMHGGTVHAASEGLGRGSTFTIELPLQAAAAASVAPEPRAATESPSSRRILIVDDNVDAADLLSMMLELEGYDTSTANDGTSALEAVAASGPDIVILDIGLPDMSGYDVARRLRETPRTAPLGLIALTGWGTAEDKQKAREAGFDVHLTKPIDADRLQSALSEVQRGVLAR